MHLFKNKFTPLTIVSLVIALSVLLPSVITFSILLSSVIIAFSFYAQQNYEIDYKYYLSFAVQLVGLILIVTSFVLVFTFITTLAMQ